jgi:selenocysteine lyase/cysteine desulfurase
MSTLSDWFQSFRTGIVGIDQVFQSPAGEQKLLYADWTASGRLYAPIEEKIHYTFGPLVGNTHTEDSVTGTAMTYAYHEAQAIIKAHVHANDSDVLLHAGFGMTAAVNKLQRILGLKVCERFASRIQIDPLEKPVVFVTHMEHHSNQTSWLETIADVVVLEPDTDGLVDLNKLEEACKAHANRPWKIGVFTACSNVTGIQTPYHQMARILHEHGGTCFIDFAASAPYVPIDMHPADPMERLDAIYFSPHKFLGGPGSSGVLIFNSEFYHNRIPDHPGGGTVEWTNPWGERRYIRDITAREDGGTPGFLQSIRAALAIRLKETMGMRAIKKREEELLHRFFAGLETVPCLVLLAGHIRERLPIVSFYLESIHYALLVKLLNDRFGIQTRGGCSCAGTYGHYLLHVDPRQSHLITDSIDHGNYSKKPGWVRVSLHPTTTDREVDTLIDAVQQVVRQYNTWKDDYIYSASHNQFKHRRESRVRPLPGDAFQFS